MVRLLDFVLIIVVISQLLDTTRLSDILIPRVLGFNNNKVVSNNVS